MLCSFVEKKKALQGGCHADRLPVVSPVVWTHYFIWLLPVLVYLSDRPGLLIIIGLVSLAGLASPYTRGLGLHMMIGLVHFGMAAFRLLKQGQSTGQL